MKLVYRHNNPVLVGLAKGLLEDAGIEVLIKNEFASSGFPPYGQDSELWVMNDQDYAAAHSLLDDMNTEESEDS